MKKLILTSIIPLTLLIGCAQKNYEVLDSYEVCTTVEVAWCLIHPTSLMCKDIKVNDTNESTRLDTLVFSPLEKSNEVNKSSELNALPMVRCNRYEYDDSIVLMCPNKLGL